MNDELKKRLEDAYLMGFRASAEGYNAEYPFNFDELEDEDWVKGRDEEINKLSCGGVR